MQLLTCSRLVVTAPITSPASEDGADQLNMSIIRGRSMKIEYEDLQLTITLTYSQRAKCTYNIRISVSILLVQATLSDGDPCSAQIFVSHPSYFRLLSSCNSCHSLYGSSPTRKERVRFCSRWGWHCRKCPGKPADQWHKLHSLSYRSRNNVCIYTVIPSIVTNLFFDLPETMDFCHQ